MSTLEERSTDTKPKPIGDAPTAVPVHRSSAPPRIMWFEGTPGRLIIEIRANDRPGLLALLTGALERAGVDIDWAKVTTPMLVIGAADDGMVTNAEVRATARAYRTDAELFPDMGHNMMQEPGWAGVAERIDAWLRTRQPA